VPIKVPALMADPLASTLSGQEGENADTREPA
jgi:hypothetical protein